MDNYINLLAAVFKQAVQDDKSQIETMLEKELQEQGVHYRKIQRIVNSYKKDIGIEVSNYVFKEYERYPDNKVTTAINNRRRIVNKIMKECRQ